MSTVIITGISLKKETFDQIESKRGLIPRSAYIQKIILEFLAKEKTN